ncbi:MAG: heavy-metal-associated domain-containing protein [Saprospiraceae bacterium]
MKKWTLGSFVFTALFSLISLSSFASDVTSTFKVNGECGMCKKKIETALRVKGVSKVNWDKETHDLTVSYNPDKITLDEIHHRIATVGYDTDTVKATDAAYSKLDQCCQYDRTKI